MADENLYPNGNTNTLWGTYDFSNIDDAVETGSTAGRSTYIIQGRKDDSEKQEHEFEATTYSAVSRIDIHIDFEFDNDGTPAAKSCDFVLDVDGTDEYTGSIMTDASGPSWTTFYVTGSWTQAEIANMSLSYDFGGVDTDEEGRLFVVYAKVTEEGGSTEPDAPTGMTATTSSDTAIALSWTAPASDGGESITGYKIERKIAAGSWSDLVADTGTTGTTYSDTGLTASTLYTYRVSAINSVGTGTASGEGSDTTDAAPTAPGTPTSLSATTSSHSAIGLSWTAPASDGGSAITGYKIEQKEGAGSWTTRVADTGSTSTSFNATSLTAETLYTYRVSAINIAGTSSASSEASDTTDTAPVTPSTSYTARTTIARSGEESGTLDVNKRTSIPRE